MKLFVMFDKSNYNTIEPRCFYYQNEADAISSSNEGNRYTCGGEYTPVLYVQEIVIDTDILLFELLNTTSSSLNSWQNTILSLIKNKSELITFGKKIDIEQIKPTLLT